MTSVKIQIDPLESGGYIATANSNVGHRYIIHASDIEKFIVVLGTYMSQFKPQAALAALNFGSQVTGEYVLDDEAVHLLFRDIAVYRQDG